MTRWTDIVLAGSAALGVHVAAIAMIARGERTDNDAPQEHIAISASTDALSALIETWDRDPVALQSIEALPVALPETAPSQSATEDAAPLQMRPVNLQTVDHVTKPAAVSAEPPTPTVQTAAAPLAQVTSETATARPATPAASAPERLAAPALMRAVPDTFPERAPQSPAVQLGANAPQRENAPREIDRPDMAPRESPSTARPNIPRPGPLAVEAMPDTGAAPEPLDARKVSLRPTLRPKHFAGLQTSKPAPQSRSAPQRRAQPTAKAQAPKRSTAQSTPRTAQPSTAQLAGLKRKWGNQIRRKIGRRIQATTSKTRSTRIEVTVFRNGRMKAVRILGSSGDKTFDRSILKGVRRIGFFPAAPKGITEASVTFDFPIRVTP